MEHRQYQSDKANVIITAIFHKTIIYLRDFFTVIDRIMAFQMLIFLR